MDQRAKIIKIVNQEISILTKQVEGYIAKEQYQKAATLSKALQSLKRVIRRIQDET